MIKENLYEELKLAHCMTVEEIQHELVQQERVWHQREITRPEKAHKMLSLIYEAREVFKTEHSKSEYDKTLNVSKESLKPTDAEDYKKHDEQCYSIDYYPCAPIATQEPVNGLFYAGHSLVLDEVESALIKVFLGQEVKITYDSYFTRNQYGGRAIEDREECWYDWDVPNEGKLRFHLMERAPESFNDGGYTKVTMTYYGSNSSLSQIKEMMGEVLTILNRKGITVMQANEIRSMAETRIAKYRKSIGRCQYCGNVFKGMMTKKCSKCGRIKDY